MQSIEQAEVAAKRMAKRVDQTQFMSEASRFIEDPFEYFGGSGFASAHLPREKAEALQLAGLQLRFAQLRDRVATLKTMADEQGVTEIKSIDDVVPLLFPHTVYKSYPVALLERNRFDQLTKWLSRLVSIDLSGVSVDSCESIDEWIAAMDAQTPLRLIHSTGTSGKLSFLPRTTADYDASMKCLRMSIFEQTDPQGSGDHSNEYFDMIWPTHSGGNTGFLRSPALMMQLIAGSPDHFHPLYSSRVSSDIMYLAGRLRTAEARGELDKVQISPKLLARRKEFEATLANSAAMADRFFENVLVKLKGKRVFMGGTWAQQYAFATKAIERGYRQWFAPDSFVLSGGGAKGQDIPADWHRAVAEFVGVKRVTFTYGMSELPTGMFSCEYQRYHVPPWTLVWTLDPDDGSVLPREGVQKGRCAVFSLLSKTCWGGFVSGDEISIDRSPCACGRTTPHISHEVSRYSEQRGGDDKISCAASEEAHQSALDFLLNGLD